MRELGFLDERGKIEDGKVAGSDEFRFFLLLIYFFSSLI